MAWRRLAGDCKGGDCPRIYLTERDTVAVQGNLLTSLGGPPPGEAVVEIPLNLLLEAAREAG